MPCTAPSTTLQGHKSLCTKVPTRKRREASKIPTYWGKKLVPNALSVDSSEDENTSSDSASNESEPCKTPTPELEEEEEATLEDTITFDVSYTAFISKEEVYANSETVRLGKWDPSDFNDKAGLVWACREAVSQNIEINLKHNLCASITAHIRKVLVKIIVQHIHQPIWDKASRIIWYLAIKQVGDVLHIFYYLFNSHSIAKKGSNDLTNNPPHRLRVKEPQFALLKSATWHVLQWPQGQSW